MTVSQPSSQRLNGRIAIITGSSSGLGRAMSLRFAGEGANLVCVDLRPSPRDVVPSEVTEGPTHELVNRKHGEGRAIFVTCDVTKPEDWSNVVAQTVEKFGRVDMCVLLPSPMTRSSRYPRLQRVQFKSTRTQD
jgi:NAD(P)-dependent dehydrogenase (short-subunit alcohol dehydrogenase family)